MQKLLSFFLIKLKAFLFSKDVLSFLLFIVLAAGIWYVNVLDKESEAELIIPIQYIGVPQNVAIVNNPPKEIKVHVVDKGLNLISYSTGEIKPICYNLTGLLKGDGQVVIPYKQLETRVNKYLLSSTMVREITVDSIEIKYERLSEKFVPVKLEGDVQPKQQYMLSNGIEISPSYVKVFAAKSILDSLKYISTKRVRLHELNENIEFVCDLKPLSNVKISVNKVKVNIEVEMFTEKRLQVPIVVVNCPSNLTVKTFPAYTDAIFNVGLSHFRTVNPNEIKIVLDYNDIIKGSKLKQQLKRVSQPPYISNLRIEPSEVEYILEVK